MSGEELKKKLDTLDVSQAKLAELMGVFPQSFNKTLQAEDVKSGFLEKLCKVLHKDISFFYGTCEANETMVGMKDTIYHLQHENSTLKADLVRLENLKLPTKESKVYDLWMKFMDITSEMQKLYKEEKGE